MFLLKKLIVTLFVSILMLGSAQAFEPANPEQTIGDVIDLNAQTIAAMQAGESAETVGALLKATKQSSKSVVISGPADVNKQRGGMSLRKSRRAFRDGDTEKAIKLATDALNYYKKAQSIAFVK